MTVDDNFFKVLRGISVYTTFIPLVVALIVNKYLKAEYKLLFIYVAIAIIVEILTTYLNDRAINNFFIFRFFSLVEFTLFSLFYYSFFRKYFNSIIILCIIPIFAAVAFVDYKINGLNEMDSFTTSVECILLGAYSLYLFYFVLQRLIFKNLLSEPIFWINSAVLLYFAGDLLLFLFSNDLLKTDIKKHEFLWGFIHSFCNMFYNVFLAVGFWKTRPR